MADERRYCPLIRKRCIQEKCEAWYENIVELTEGNQKRIVPKKACIEFFWKPMYLKAIAGNTEGSQIAVENLRNVEADGLGFLTNVMHTAMQTKRLNNGG